MHQQGVRAFVESHFRHFNAAEVRRAAAAYVTHVDSGGKMFLALGGAMSTAELGVSLAPMIRQGKVHAICCTGANLEEDVFRLFAGDKYVPIEHRKQRPEDDAQLCLARLNRVTDVCLPDDEIWRRLEMPFKEVWKHAERKGERLFPHEVVFRVLSNERLKTDYRTDPGESWTLAAMECGVPIFVPAWEDSSTGNMYAASCLRGEIRDVHTVRTGIEAMMELAKWYFDVSLQAAVGFFQIGGGVAGDFPICVVPTLNDDVNWGSVPTWRYFCQIGDSTTSYGSYSGATPSEKISWGKLDATTPSFMIESDATIVAPLIFAYVLDA